MKGLITMIYRHKHLWNDYWVTSVNELIFESKWAVAYEDPWLKKNCVWGKFYNPLLNHSVGAVDRHQLDFRNHLANTKQASKWVVTASLSERLLKPDLHVFILKDCRDVAVDNLSHEIINHSH